MPGFEIRAINEHDLPEVVPFMLRSTAALQIPRTPPAESEPEAFSLADFRWLLQESARAIDDRIPSGEIIRNPAGVVVGMIGYSPKSFWLGSKRFLGLGAHNYYVDSGVGMQAFILFKRYMNNPAADFCFSTTCNANSGPLWTKMGAAKLPNSDAEFLLVLKTGPFLEEVAHRKRIPVALARALGPVGSLADFFIRASRGRRRLKIERCQDWGRLAAIAERYRDHDRLTPERTELVLRELHEAVSQCAISTGGIEGIYRFADSRGHEGWLSLRTKTRGRSKQIRSVILHDLVWPRSSFEIADILSAISEATHGWADVLSVRDFASLGLNTGQRGLRKWALPAPEGFIVSQARSGLPSANDLALITDFPEAYGA